MKFIIALLLIPQLALASVAPTLKEVMDDFNYSVTVEWDQQDQKFLEEKTQKLNHDIQVLIENGLTKEEIVEVSGLDMNVEAIDFKNPAEVANYVRTHQTAAKGASWNGDVLAIGVVVGLAVLVLAWAVKLGVDTNRKFDECVAQNNGNEEPCIDR